MIFAKTSLLNIPNYSNIIYSMCYIYIYTVILYMLYSMLYNIYHYIYYIYIYIYMYIDRRPALCPIIEGGSVNRCFQVGKVSQKGRCGKLGRRRDLSNYIQEENRGFSVAQSSR